MIDFNWITVCGYAVCSILLLLFGGCALAGVFERYAKENNLMKGDSDER